VCEPARHLLGRGQDEGVRARRDRLDAAEGGVVQLHELPQLREVGAHEGEVVLLVERADAPDAVAPVALSSWKPSA
jgi:hypothetical protein